MADLEKVCNVGDVPQNSMRGFSVHGKRILVVHFEYKFYALGAVCSHRGGDLAQGKLEGKLVTCPVHGAKYDVTTGKVVKNVNPIIALFGSAKDLNTYQVKIEGGDVLVQV